MKSYFFNAVKTPDIASHPSGYDREYDADDHAAFFAPFFSEAGVFAGKESGACKVQVQSGNTLVVSAGAVYIRGRMALLDGTDTITVSGDCRVAVRMNKAMEVRNFHLVAVTELTRTEDVYDLELATVAVRAVTGGYEAQVTDTRTFLSHMGQPPFCPPDTENLPYLLWVYTMGFPMTAEQRAAVEGNQSLMEIYRGTRVSAHLVAADAHEGRFAAAARDAQEKANAAAAGVQGNLNGHAGDRGNPHGVTAGQAGAVALGDKASAAEAMAGVSDGKWMTPAGVKAAVDVFDTRVGDQSNQKYQLFTGPTVRLLTVGGPSGVGNIWTITPDETRYLNFVQNTANNTTVLTVYNNMGVALKITHFPFVADPSVVTNSYIAFLVPGRLEGYPFFADGSVGARVPFIGLPSAEQYLGTPNVNSENPTFFGIVCHSNYQPKTVYKVNKTTGIATLLETIPYSNLTNFCTLDNPAGIFVVACLTNPVNGVGTYVSNRIIKNFRNDGQVTVWMDDPSNTFCNSEATRYLGSTTLWNANDGRVYSASGWTASGSKFVAQYLYGYSIYDASVTAIPMSLAADNFGGLNAGHCIQKAGSPYVVGRSQTLLSTNGYLPLDSYGTAFRYVSKPAVENNQVYTTTRNLLYLPNDGFNGVVLSKDFIGYSKKASLAGGFIGV